MSLVDAAACCAAATLAALALAGLVYRCRLGASALFPAYLASAAAGHALLAAFPGVFWTWRFLAATDALQTALVVGVAFEIAFKTFGALPRGRRRVRRLMALVALGTALALLPLHGEATSAFGLARLFERASYGAAFLFLAFLAVVRYHAVPLDPLHRTIATGFGVVALLAGCVSALWQFDPALGLGRDAVVKTAYPCLLGWWARSAWRRDDYGRLSTQSVRRLHPWRVA